jgi:4-amino-4-deoxy-L-arabinose transferase-like glycosyltransferase
LAAPRLANSLLLRPLAWMLASGLIAACLCVYLSNAFGPPRLGYDVPEYLKIAEAINAGEAYDNHQWPVGYPIVLVCIWRAGICGNPGLILFNLGCLTVGLAFTFAIGRRFLALSWLELACLGAWTLASRVTLDLATIWQPEMAFLFTTTLATYCLWRATQRTDSAVVWLSVGTLCAVASIALRNIGVALIPAVIWTGTFVSRDWSPVRRAGLLARVAGLTGLAAISLINFGLFREASGPDAQPPRAIYQATGYVSGILGTLDTRWEEASEIVANVGYSAGWPVQARPAGFCLGIAFVLAAALGIWQHRRSPAAIYLASYFAILAVWPYYMPRFWAPVLPLVACFAWVGCKTFAARFQWPTGTRETLVTAYCALFVTLGFYTFSMEWRKEHSAAIVALADSLPPPSNASDRRLP